MTEEKHPFQPGVEVAIVTRHCAIVAYKLGKVAKVHKTGHFVLEGAAQQYAVYRAPFNGDDGKWSARPTGRTGHSSSVSVEFVTDELRMEAAKTRLKGRWRSAVGNIYQLINKAADRATPEHCADLERIIAELTGERHD